MEKLSRETVLPLDLVLAFLSVSLGVAVAGTFWVASVNSRLSRIEERLEIRLSDKKDSAGIGSAWAGERLKKD